MCASLFSSLIFRSTIIHSKTSGGRMPAHAEGERRTGQRKLQQSVDYKASRSADHTSLPIAINTVMLYTCVIPEHKPEFLCTSNCGYLTVLEIRIRD